MTLLDSARSSGRVVVVASLNPFRLRRFKKACRIRKIAPFPTNVSVQKMLTHRILAWLWPLRLLPSNWAVRRHQFIRRRLSGKAYETSFVIVDRALVRSVQQSGGGIYVFLTRFGWAALDGKDTHETYERIIEILCMGVDGIMTDYPEFMRTVIDRYRNRWPGICP
ncbi:MAG: hypothetical protein O7H41_00550 [Planctomycetota bacterium]|nr:hypothetical protein [Planctomycetota bacterium]